MNNERYDATYTSNDTSARKDDDDDADGSVTDDDGTADAARASAKW